MSRLASSPFPPPSSPMFFLILTLALICFPLFVHGARGAFTIFPNSKASSVVYDDSLTRDLPLGKVMGSTCVKFGNWMHFYGIPYALPPLKNLRYRPPQKYNISYGFPALFAVSPPPLCSYICSDGNPNYSFASEDCLYLNVWAPRELPSTLLPVRAYIHGGHDMCSSMDYYGEACALGSKTNSIHVSMEFRRGPMGHLAHPATWGESNTTGNWALMDQQLALVWIQENIVYFGGDPNSVLLYGHSAGAQGVEMHTISTKSYGLYHSVISQSAPCTILPTLQQAYNYTQYFLPIVGCDGKGSGEAELECLRQVPWSVLYNLTTLLTDEYDEHLLACSFRERYGIWDYIVDGNLIPSQLLDAIHQGKYNKVPYMVGSAADDGMSNLEGIYGDDLANITIATIISALDELYPGVDSNYILDVYPEGLFESDAQPSATRLAQIFTDIAFNCPIYGRISARSAGGDRTVWQYRWGATPSCPADAIFKRAYHGSELYFVFGNMPVYEFADGLCTFSDEEVKLSYLVMNAWTKMGRQGTPMWQNGTVWPTWDNANQHTVFLDKGFTDIVDTKNMEQRCARHNLALSSASLNDPDTVKDL